MAASAHSRHGYMRGHPRFQLHLANTGMSICNRNRIMTGLRFLFRVTLRRLDLAEDVYHIREPQKLPLVMSIDEMKRSIGYVGASRVPGRRTSQSTMVTWSRFQKSPLRNAAR